MSDSVAENKSLELGPVEEGFSFEDSDHFEDMSICSWMSEQESFSTNWRGWKQNNHVSSGNESGKVLIKF